MNTRIIFPLAFILVLSFKVNAQQDSPNPEKGFFKYEIERYKALMKRSASDINSTTAIDVKYYRLDLNVTTSPQYLRGKMLMKAISMQNGLSDITLDLMSSLMVDSVHVNGIKTTSVQQPSTFDINLDRTYNADELIAVEVFYQGIPGSSGFGSFEFSSHSGTPWVWTLSEPYGAKDWWPCNDHPMDKADSADIFVTCDAAYKVGSNGKLLSVVNNGDGTSTHHWKTLYPISTYLISIAITNYSSFSNWFKYSPTDSMEVLSYVLPEHLSSALSGLPKAVDGLTIYSSFFGLYPFITEKYGNAEFGWGGGMEHQTMTYLGGFSEDLVMHELAHQWFGDMITCRTWPDVWLNEGFATYLEVLYQERKYGSGMYWSRINGDMASAKNAAGSVYLTDTSNVGSMFSWNVVYAKGAIALHMLRHVMGDSSFFHAMYNYANDPRFKYGTASTADFKSICETASGKNLNYFFNQWIYGEKYPRYKYGWTSVPSAGGYKVAFGVTQATLTSNPAFFTMPIDITLYAPGWDTTVVLFNDQLTQSFEFEVSHQPTSLQFDPAGWILKSKDSLKAITLSYSSKNFGDAIVNFSKNDSITVYNTGLTTLEITSAYSDSGDFSITPAGASIPVSSNQKFYIRFTPSVAGVRTGHIFFVHTAPNSPEQLNVAGTGQNSSSTFNDRWNMISIPFTVDDPRKSTLFASAISNMFRYRSDSGYISTDTLVPGLGYWLKLSAGGDLNITGNPPVVDTIEVLSGWNLIGSTLHPISAASIQSVPADIIRSSFFGYENSYMLADSLKPFKGYWIKVSQAGKIVLDVGTTSSKSPSGNDLLSQFSTLTIVDAKGVSQRLYFGIVDGRIDPDRYELPPLFANGSLDVRFQSGRSLEVIKSGQSDEYPIQITSENYPLTLEWNMRHLDSPVILKLGNRKISLRGNGTTSIQNQTAHISLRADGSGNLPAEFALEQNYPNPFNPLTVIRYQLPADSWVTLKVFDVLGQEVATLVDELQKAGYRTVTFNADKLSSGIYFCHLQSGAFREIKKILLIR